MPRLSRVRLVLVGTRHPGNVGACARLCANYDVRDWTMADAKCRWDDFDARKFATGSAEKNLAAIRETKTVREATSDCVAAIGFTRRLGKTRRPSLELSQLSELIENASGKIALVFGNEETGLTADELEPCTHVCQLATSENHPSLNLSHAVNSALSRVYDDLGPRAKSKPKKKLARLSELEGMYTHWREFMLDVGLDRAGNPERLLHRFREIFDRSQLDAGEIRAIRALLSKAQVKLGVRQRGKRVAKALAALLLLSSFAAASHSARAADGSVTISNPSSPASEPSPLPPSEPSNEPLPPSEAAPDAGNPELVGPPAPGQEPGMREEDLESYRGDNDAGSSYRLPPFRLGVNYQWVANAFDLTPSDDQFDKYALTYRPAQSQYIGLIAGYKWLGGTVSISLPETQSTQDNEGKSQYQDYRLSYYASHFGIEAAFNRYVGFLIDNSSILPASDLNGASYYKIPDLEVMGVGLNLMYVFRPDRYSLPAALDQTAVQSSSGGSALLLATWREQWIETQSGNPIIPASMRQYFGEDADLSEIHSRDVAVGGGYGYLWNRDAFFWSLLGALTAGYEYATYNVDEDTERRLGIALNANVRAGVGFNSTHYFLTATLYYDRFYAYTRTITISDDIYGVTGAVGVRF